MKSFRKCLLIFIVSMCCTIGYAQSLFKTGAYQIGFGASTLLGDLGGSLGAGSINSIKDFDDETVGYNLSIASDWGFSKRVELRTNFNYVSLNANDKYSEELSRKLRNLSVKTNVLELVPSIKINFLTHPKQSTKISHKKKLSQIYTCLGIGFIYYNPKAKYNGKSYSLKSLKTEGQGLEGGAKPYSGFSYIIPITIGFHNEIKKGTFLFYEFTLRKSFTDYLDDVSTVYYDNDKLAASKGNVAAELADRNLGLQNNKQGVKRGNSENKDNYFTFNFGYKRALLKYNARRN